MPYYQESTPRKEAETALRALTSGDLREAIIHIGMALQLEPLEPEWLGILDEVLSRTADAARLVRVDDAQSDAVAAAVRGYILAQTGRFQEALLLVGQAAALKPEAPFLQWAVDWLRRPGVAQSIPADLVESQLVPKILQFVSAMPSPADPDDERHRSLVAAHQLCAALSEVHPRAPYLLFARSLIARRLSQIENAIQLAYDAFQIRPDWGMAIGVAMAYRDNGQVDEAVGWFRYASSLDPEDVSALLDIGDTYLEAERCSDAIAAYEEVLERQPGHPWAVPSIQYARFLMSGDDSDKWALFALTEQSERAWELFCRIQPPEPYVAWLPPAADTTAKALRTLIDNLSDNPAEGDGGTIELAAPFLESPSVLTAFRLWTERHGITVNVKLAIEGVQTPDPRKPKWKVDILLWRYEGLDAQPNVDPPDPRAAEAIAEIAREPFNLELWEPKARELAEKMGPSWLRQILQTMVHPPPLPTPDQDPMAWVQKVQIAAALVAGLIDAGWEDSYRKRALYAIALGPVDWTVGAGIAVMGWLARRDRSIRKDAEQLFDWLKKLIPKEGYTCFEYPLACAWLGLGEHDDATLERLASWQQAIEERRQAATGPVAAENPGGAESGCGSSGRRIP